MIERKIRDKIVDIANINSDRIFFGRGLRGQKPPYITVEKTSAERMNTLDGADGAVLSTFQVSAFDDEYVKAKVLAESVYSLQDHRDSDIKAIHFGTESDLVDDDERVFGVVMEFDVRHREMAYQEPEEENGNEEENEET